MAESVRKQSSSVSRLGGLEAVIFDLDDTLYLETSYVRSGFGAVAQVLADEHSSVEYIGRLLWRAFEQGPRDRVFNSVLRELGREDESSEISRLVRCYREHRPTLALEPAMRDLLGRVGRLYKLGLLTDGFLPAQQYKVEALGLTEVFDCIVYTEALGREFWKPSPRAFELMSESLGCAGSRCVYVADNVAKDFVGPNQLGWRTIRLLRPGQLHYNDGKAAGPASVANGDTLAQYTVPHLGGLEVLLGLAEK